MTLIKEPSSTAVDVHLERNLSNRHIQLIAIGGAIGTGLFMGSGKTIATAGPAVLLVYVVIGAALFLFMRAMGELLLSSHSDGETQYGTFADIARDLIGPWAGFVTGWTYWLCWVVTGVADMVAIVGYTHFWWPTLPAWIPILVTVAVLLSLNLLTVKAFGETEFWFALIKVVAILALIGVGIYFVVTRHQDAGGEVARLSNVWSYGGFFPHGLAGFIGAFPLAIFAFAGVELVGTTTAETKDPEKNLPRAINSIPVRIMLFYIGALAVIMMVTPWVHIDPGKSPFVTMFSMTGLAAAATIVNLVVLTSAASSANSGIYSTSRMLYGLSTHGDAPKVFGVLSSRKVPRNALFLSCVLLLTAIVLMAAGNSVMGAFTMITAMSATLFMAVWTIVVIAYLRYLKRFPDKHVASKFKSPLGAVGAWIFIGFITVMVVILSMESESRIGLIASAIWLGAIITVARRRARRTA